MSSKTLVWIAFALWSLICWRWYVCGIKQACGKTVEASTATRPSQETAALEMDTAQADEAASSKTPAAALKPQENSVSTEAVQVIESGDDAEIHFPYNSTQKEDKTSIDSYLSRLAAQLESSGHSVTITGHTDGIGDAKTNLAFAERRAKNIRDILIAKGVDRKKITCKSYGESKPIATNDTPEGRYKNRRVEIKVGH